MAGIMKDGQPYFFGSSESYSTEEQVIGTWIDGKPIYRKTISCGTLPKNTPKSVAHGISNLEMITNLYGISKNVSSNVYINVNYAPNSNNISSCYITGDSIQLSCTSDRTTYTETYVTIEYTKTTD